MNNLVWFKCPSNLTGNKQIKMMIDKEGARGYGSYLYIIELLSQQSTGKLTFDELRIFQQKGFSTRYMERIIRNYNLFIIDGETFASAYSFLGDEKTKKNSPKTTAHTTQSISQSIDQTIDKSTSQSSDQSTTQMIDQSITQTIAKSRNSRKGDKCQNINKLKQTKKCLPPYIKEKEIDKIENKKDITTPPIILPSVAEAAVEKEVAEIKSFDEGGGTNCPQQVKSWQMCIEEMSKDESWLEAVCMNSGYSALLKRNMKEAIDYFVKHAFTYDNLNSILTLHDAKQYFANYVRQGKQTSKRLEEHLLLHEKLTGYTDNQPQSYEDIIDGKRSYLGSFIPDYAPPRPNANSFWHDELRRWIE